MVFTLELPLVPAPASASVGEGRMPLPEHLVVDGPADAAHRLLLEVEQRTGIGGMSAHDGAHVELRIDPAVAAPEGYTLDVVDGIRVVGADDAGLFYGIQSLLQLIRQDAEGAWSVHRASIADAPRFTHRGVMLDVARHFFTVSEVRRLIDAASALKLNRLHLHLSDDQGWRIAIGSRHLLTELASDSAAGGEPGGFYSASDYREIVEYAAAHHMVVIPEIDLPGHTHAVGVAYPDLVEEPVIDEAFRAQAASLGQALPVAGVPYTGWGVGHSSLRIHDERTYEFIGEVIAELAALTPGPYLHIGGDEALGTTAEDYALFISRATRAVVDAGKTPIAWHEAGAAADLARGTIGQYWGSVTAKDVARAETARFVEREGAVILSPSDVAYLDMKYTPDFPLGLDWAGTIDVRKAYEWDPTSVLDIDALAILGVEAPLWSETARTFEHVQLLAFPRIAAVAEIAWSTAAGRDWESFRVRLGSLAPLWTAAGISYHPTDDVPWTER
ncbi:family 20 glycosylhydrolase [Microbacterium sp. ZW T5_45]|uniref:family 20 glycosylhydrolase n=1 Tax=Microbacterium sp. ZW T5_45 TaxID=3378080 RepID=UPI003851B543